MNRLQLKFDITTEWVWVVGRMWVVAASIIGAQLFYSGTNDGEYIIIASALVLIYNAILAYFLRQGYQRPVAVVGTFLDSSALLAVWWAIAISEQGAAFSNDLYLVLFPILIIASVRLGPLWGMLHAAIWIFWLVWSTKTYYAPSGYDVTNLPIRAIVIAITVGLTSFLVHKYKAENSLRQETEVKLRSSNAELRTTVERVESAHNEIVALNRLMQEDLSKLFVDMNAEIDLQKEQVGNALDGVSREAYLGFLSRLKSIVSKPQA